MKLLIQCIRINLGQIRTWFLIGYIYPFKYAPGIVRSFVPKQLTIGKYPVIEQDVYFSNHLKSIGNECFIGCQTVIDNCSEIGSFSSISKDVKIGMNNHHLDSFSTSTRFYLKKYGRVSVDDIAKSTPTIIKEDVLVSTNAVILSGLTIGRGAVIAAGAVVIKDVEPYSIVGGVPAKLIRYRLDENTRKKLMGIDFNNPPELAEAMASFNK